MGFPWTKFQDFYLRLGFLKVLTCILDPWRRSALNQAIERRLMVPLFEPATKYPVLWSAVRDCFPDAPLRTAANKRKFTTVTDALLVAGDCPSALFAITPETAYKVLDWGHDVYMVGRGNQITERALVLRALLPMEAADRFLAGDVSAWNPFPLTIPEKLFFLYHLGEIDQMMIDLISALASRTSNSALEAADAARVTCQMFFELLTRSESDLLPRETPKYRTALDLACVIADELELKDYAHICGGARGASRKIGKPGAKRFGLSRVGASQRRTTKSADHQTIPRFEQLTDLGFIRKPDDAKSRENVMARKRWRYLPTDACRRWQNQSATAASVGSKYFWWNGFAKAAVRAYDLGSPHAEPEDDVVARYFWRAYEKIHRPVGHTPLDSVALLGMIYAAVDGIAIEIELFHQLMMRIKQDELLPNHAYFASGNEIDKMFILLKPGFIDALAGIRLVRQRERANEKRGS